MRRAARTFLLGQTLFYVSLLVCILLKPEGLSANDGISYYGVFRETFPPYATGLLGAALFTLQSAGSLPARARVLSIAFKAYTPLILGLVVTPYTGGRVLNDLHVACGSLLFSLQLIVSGWVTWRFHYALWCIAFSFAELSAGIASAIYLHPAHGFLLQSQVIFQLTFGAFVSLVILRLSEPQIRLPFHEPTNMKSS